MFNQKKLIMLINLSNHPSSEWPEKQIIEAERFGGVIDLAFPSIDPMAETFQIEELAKSYEIKLRKLRAKEADFERFTVHLMGELTFCCALVKRLQKNDIKCVASTTTRKTFIQANGAKISHFEFVRFREYSNMNINT